ncbi:MAG TPA: hypothetical protein ENJ53_00195 [Phaeodactylibacter sp.]|nr:hypothetical protein [Phaeodactylibacter sp.]
MTVQEKIIMYVREIDDVMMLNRILDYINKVKDERKKEKGNIDVIRTYAGIMSDEEADEMKKIIDEAFGHIDGKW